MLFVGPLTCDETSTATESRNASPTKTAGHCGSRRRGWWRGSKEEASYSSYLATSEAHDRGNLAKYAHNAAQPAGCRQRRFCTSVSDRVGPACLSRDVGRSDNMIPTRHNRIVVWFLVIMILGAIGLLVRFLPIVAAVLFVACVTFMAVAVGRARGFWSGVKVFIKEMLFGW